jgi:hypothetical protein
MTKAERRDRDAMCRAVVLATVRRLRMATVAEVWRDLHPHEDGRLCSLTGLHAHLKALRDADLVAQLHFNSRRAAWTATATDPSA